MAAFIQKLFKSRKTTEATPNQRKATQPEPVEQEDTRTDRREEQLKTLESAPSQDVLAKLAIEGVTADIRQSAAGRLTDEASLQDVQKQAKGRDKGVYQIVKLALQQRREEQARLDSISQTIATLTRHAQDQAKSDDTKLYEARLDALLKQWTEVETHASPEQAQAFLEAVHLCKERIAALQSAAEDEKRQREQKLQRQETLDLLTRTLDELKSQPPETLPSLASLDALQKTQENRWLEATRDTAVEKQEQKAYENAMLALRNYLSSVRRITQERETIAELGALLERADDATDEQRAQAKTLVAEINWPEGYPIPALLEPLRKLAGKRKKPAEPRVDQEQQKALTTRLEAEIRQLEEALEAKQLKESKQIFKTAQQHFRDLDQRHAKPYQARMQLLTGQLRELSDWQGFATEPKQIALCEQMEYLAEQPMDPEAKAERIKELQNEWRDLGAKPCVEHDRLERAGTTKGEHARDVELTSLEESAYLAVVPVQSCLGQGLRALQGLLLCQVRPQTGQSGKTFRHLRAARKLPGQCRLVFHRLESRGTNPPDRPPGVERGLASGIPRQSGRSKALR